MEISQNTLHQKPKGESLDLCHLPKIGHLEKKRAQTVAQGCARVASIPVNACTCVGLRSESWVPWPVIDCHLSQFRDALPSPVVPLLLQQMLCYGRWPLQYHTAEAKLPGTIRGSSRRREDGVTEAKKEGWDLSHRSKNFWVSLVVK